MSATAPGAAHRSWRTARLEGVRLYSPRGLSGLVLLICILLVLAVEILIAAKGFFEPAPVDELSEDEMLSVLLGQILLNLFLGVLPVVAYVGLVRPGGSAWRRVGLGADTRLPLHVVLGIGLAAALFVVAVLLGTFLPASNDPDAERLAVSMARAVADRPAVLVAVAFGIGFTEEVVFRGFLQPRIGLWGQAAVFGLAHLAYGSLWNVALAGAGGLLLGWVYRRTGSLWGPIVAHAGYDAALLVQIAGSSA